MCVAACEDEGRVVSELGEFVADVIDLDAYVLFVLCDQACEDFGH